MKFLSVITKEGIAGRGTASERNFGIKRIGVGSHVSPFENDKTLRIVHESMRRRGITRVGKCIPCRGTYGKIAVAFVSVRDELGRAILCNQKAGPTFSSRPGKLAGCDLLDFLYSFTGRVEPNTYIPITLPKLGGQVCDRYTFASRCPQGADYSPLQSTAR